MDDIRDFCESLVKIRLKTCINLGNFLILSLRKSDNRFRIAIIVVITVCMDMVVVMTAERLFRQEIIFPCEKAESGVPPFSGGPRRSEAFKGYKIKNGEGL